MQLRLCRRQERQAAWRLQGGQAAPPGYACKCIYQGGFTCGGQVQGCYGRTSSFCQSPDTSVQACVQGNGDCQVGCQSTPFPSAPRGGGCSRTRAGCARRWRALWMRGTRATAPCSLLPPILMAHYSRGTPKSATAPTRRVAARSPQCPQATLVVSAFLQAIGPAPASPWSLARVTTLSAKRQTFP